MIHGFQLRTGNNTINNRKMTRVSPTNQLLRYEVWIITSTYVRYSYPCKYSTVTIKAVSARRGTDTCQG